MSGYRITEHESLCWMPISGLNAEEWAPADAPAVEKLKTLA